MIQFGNVTSPHSDLIRVPMAKMPLSVALGSMRSIQQSDRGDSIISFQVLRKSQLYGKHVALGET